MIYFATANLHKKEEMEQLFPDIHLATPGEAGLFFDPPETGESFLENSLIKARVLWDLVRAPVLADDSGLAVDILSGAPGVYSARYRGKDAPRGVPGQEDIPSTEKNRLLLEQVHQVAAGRPGPHRCRFVCSLVLMLSPSRFYIAQETLEGSLMQSMAQSRGQNGFGYDPIVVVAGTDKTVAELSATEKNHLSHRGKAARALAPFILALEGQSVI